MNNRIANWIIGELLELANREFRSQEFYSLKDRILKACGRKVGYDTQHIVKTCRSCEGEGRMLKTIFHLGKPFIAKCETCWRCGGSGKYDEFWVRLDVYKLGARSFHLPVDRQYSHDLFEKILNALNIVPGKHFEGLIRHTPPSFHLGREAGWWLVLLFDRPSLHSYYFGMNYQYGFIFTPLLLINNLIYFTTTNYRKAKNSLVNLRRKLCKHNFAWTDDPWANDECRKCGVERWELEENKPIF